MLTIFTPTYNRAYIIEKLYISLKNQTCQDFEWIVVDDDSTDNTEDLFKTFESIGQGIRYVKQEHGGKHRAINKGVKIAKGDFFFIVDSDDYLTTNAVELISMWTRDLQSIDDKICGVAGLRISPAGLSWGGNPEFGSAEYIDATNIDREKYGLLGDKAEVYSTNILKKYPFPEYDNEFFLTEAVVWDSIAIDGYKIRWYKEPIYVCEYLDDGLTKTGANDRKGHIKNPRGYAKYAHVQIKAYGIRKAIGFFVDSTKIAKELHIPLRERIEYLGFGSFKYLIYTCIGVVWRIANKLKKNRRNS